MRYNFKIEVIDKTEFIRMVHKFHYSKVMPRLTKYYLGCFNDGVLVGGLSLGWGTQPKATIKKLFSELDTKDYFEIGKMVMDESMPKNSETQMLSQVKKWIKKELAIDFLYTWADGIVGKAGYVYQAFNFYYGGFIWTDIYVTEKGEKVHPRSTRDLCKENAVFKGKDKIFWLTEDFMKTKGIRRIKGKQFRYIMPMSKKGEKLLKSKFDSWNLPYPKEKDLIWREKIEGKWVEVCRPFLDKNEVKYNIKNLQKQGVGYCQDDV